MKEVEVYIEYTYGPGARAKEGPYGCLVRITPTIELTNAGLIRKGGGAWFKNPKLAEELIEKARGQLRGARPATITRMTILPDGYGSGNQPARVEPVPSVAYEAIGVGNGR